MSITNIDKDYLFLFQNNIAIRVKYNKIGYSGLAFVFF